MRADALRAELATIDGPVIVCAQAGNVNTGAFDPFAEIAPIVHERGGWLHVDGAFGIWAAAVPSLRERMRGHDGSRFLVDRRTQVAERAVRLGAGLRPRRGRASRGHDASVPRTTSSPTAAHRDSYNWVPESSRRARGFAIVAALRSLGRQGLVDLIERDCALARRMAERLAAAPGVDDPQRGRPESGPRRLRERRPDQRRHRRRPARRHVLAGRHDLGGPCRDADLGLGLADDRGRHRPLGRRHPAVPRRGQLTGLVDIPVWRYAVNRAVTALTRWTRTPPLLSVLIALPLPM